MPWPCIRSIKFLCLILSNHRDKPVSYSLATQNRSIALFHRGLQIDSRRPVGPGFPASAWLQHWAGQFFIQQGYAVALEDVSNSPASVNQILVAPSQLWQPEISRNNCHIPPVGEKSSLVEDHCLTVFWKHTELAKPCDSVFSLRGISPIKMGKRRPAKGTQAHRMALQGVAFKVQWTARLGIC